MVSGIARSKGSTIIIRTRPAILSLWFLFLPCWLHSHAAFFLVASGNSRFRAHSLSIPSGKRGFPSQMFQHKPKNDVSLLGLESGELITLVSRSNAVLGQVSCKSISGSREVDDLTSNSRTESDTSAIVPVHQEFSFPAKWNQSLRAPHQVNSC